MSDTIVAVIGLVGSAAGAIWAAYVGTRRRVLAERAVAEDEAEKRGSQQLLEQLRRDWA